MILPTAALTTIEPARSDGLLVTNNTFRYRIAGVPIRHAQNVGSALVLPRKYPEKMGAEAPAMLQ
jgi:hypothetical protein